MTPPVRSLVARAPRRRLLAAWVASLALSLAVPAGAQPAPPAVTPPGLPAGVAPVPAGLPPPPVAPVRDVPETFHGTTVHDPYRALEDKAQPEVQAWMRAQGEHTRQVLARLPGRQRLLDRLVALDEAVPVRVAAVLRQPGGRLFYERRDPGDNQFKLHLRQPGSDRLLVDPAALERRTGKPHAINYYDAAPGGDLLVYGLSQQGSEEAVLHRLDTRTGRPVGAPIDRANWAGPSFSADGRHLAFTRLQALRPGAPEVEKYRNASVWLMPARGGLAQARRVLGAGMPGVQLAPDETPSVSFTHDGRWALGLVQNGVQREFRLYLSSAAEVLRGQPRWRPVVDTADQITGLSYHGDTLYLLSHRGAPRFQVLGLDLRQPDMARAQVLVPQGEGVIAGLAAAADALYLEVRSGNAKRLLKRPLGLQAGPALQEVPLPVTGSFALADGEGGPGAAHPDLPGLVLDLQGWTRARQIYEVQADGQVRNTGLQPAGPHDTPEGIEATEVLVTSHDGTRVPMSVIHRKGLVLDGRHPTLLYGYASYGMTEEPFFSLSRLAWLEAGGVMAVINPRGSGVFGQDWHMGGFQATKPNTWKDTIACAQWLIDQGYTRPQRLGLWGASAGGILVGRSITERPDLFAVAVPQVGALDMIRSELMATGPANIPEFGTRTNEPGFRALLAMSTYHQIRDATAYPAVMLVHGVHDPRVEVWESSKVAARLQAASTSGRPVLLRLDWDAGHGIGSTKRQQLEERADVFAFMLWQMGHPDFQPR
ncbi:prolyl oligopeptidase family serine peptidase [Ideonella livida]|uniref:prolyl oligopeptidase n=1 Tax=Ideonella livida TaxID=2707176 RepID=A0A7C9TNL4_9BURK|nr:prolyl oligopeptidase family serine peptidase [Ideonella livida]NDY93387.1 prolyl oligopeptidase family serine peptidase [Ideonella livida]